MIDGKASNVTEASGSWLKFVTPETSTVGAVTAQITVNSVEATFAYTTDSSASVTSISPRKASTISRTTISITGAGFGSYSEADVRVLIGLVECLVATVTATEITCDVDGGPPGAHDVHVILDGYGYASGSLSFKFEFEILGITPTSGSIKGGTILTINGAGFGLGEGFEDNVVSVGVYNAPCETIHQNYTTVVCATGPLIFDEADKQVLVALSMKNYYAQCSIEASGSPSSGKRRMQGDTGDLISAGENCVFSYSSTSTPTINDENPIEGIYGDEVAIAVEISEIGSNTWDVFLAPNSTLCSKTKCRDPTLSETEGFQKCALVDSTDISISFSVPNVEAGPYRYRQILEKHMSSKI